MATTAAGRTGRITINPKPGILAAALLAVAMGSTALFAATSGLGSAGVKAEANGALVEKALIQHRAGERAPLSGDSNAAEKALIQHRAGERAPLVTDPGSWRGR
jgi:hypothetical protein